MAWSETMVAIQQFYNAFDLDRRVKVLEQSEPIIAYNRGGKPVDDSGHEYPVEADTVWIIKELDEKDNKDYVTGASMADENGEFTNIVGFKSNAEATAVAISDALKTVLDNLTGESVDPNVQAAIAAIASHFDDIDVEVTVDKLQGTVPVEKGGTGRNTLTSGQILLGNGTNPVALRAITTTVSSSTSVNIPTEGAVYSYAAPRSHATTTASSYGAGNATYYGHVRLSDTYTSNVGNASSSTGASQTALYNAYNTLQNQFDAFLGYSVSGNTLVVASNSGVSNGVLTLPYTS